MLRSSEAAKALGVSKKTLLALAQDGLIPCIQLPSGHYRFVLEDVISALRSDNEGGHDNG